MKRIKPRRSAYLASARIASSACPNCSHELNEAMAAGEEIPMASRVEITYRRAAKGAIDARRTLQRL